MYYWHFVFDVNTRYYSNVEIVKYAYREEREWAMTEWRKREWLMDYCRRQHPVLQQYGDCEIRVQRRWWVTDDGARTKKKRLIHYWHFVVDISTRFYSNMEIVKYAYRATDDGARKDDNQSITDTALSIWRLWNTRTEKREREWQWNKRRH